MKKKMPKGVKQLADGRYELRVQFLDPKTGRPKNLVQIVTAESPEEAAYLRTKQRSNWLSQRTGVSNKRPHLSGALDAWLDKKVLAPSTLDRYRTAIKEWQSVLGGYYLDALHPDDVSGVMAGWQACGLGVETINSRLRVLRTFAKEAHHPEIVAAVRILAATVDKDEEDEDNGRGLTLEELRAFLAAIDKTKFLGRQKSEVVWPPLLRLMGWTGLRFGEATALEWRDLDAESGTLRIRRGVWRGVKGKAKSKAAKREIVLPPEVVDSLRTYRRERQIDAGVITLEGLMFRSVRSESGYLTNGGLRKNMIKVCKRARIDLDGRPALHCLRHTINNILRTATSELVRQAMIGHADDKQNARYSKVSAEEKRAAMGAVIALVRGT